MHWFLYQVLNADVRYLTDFRSMAEKREVAQLFMKMLIPEERKKRQAKADQGRAEEQPQPPPQPEDFAGDAIRFII